jgi:hypothetical protein
MNMNKNYPEQLGDWVKRRKSTQRDRNLVAFLAIRDDVKAALDASYSVKTVWTNMHECKRIEVGYEVFLHYVNRLIRHPIADHVATVPNSRLSNPLATIGQKLAPGATPAASVTKPVAPAGFVFDPVPRKEDLV